MACTLSIQDYLHFFMTKTQDQNGINGEKKGKTNGIPQGSLLVATVYKYEKGGGESVFYSKRILGSKQTEPISLFVQEMIGTGRTFYLIFVCDHNSLPDMKLESLFLSFVLHT